jgi:hypothetical protein
MSSNDLIVQDIHLGAAIENAKGRSEKAVQKSAA